PGDRPGRAREDGGTGPPRDGGRGSAEGPTGCLRGSRRGLGVGGALTLTACGQRRGRGPSAGVNTRSSVCPGPVVPRRDAAPRRRAAPATPHPVARPRETITRAAPVKALRRRRRRRDAPWAYVRFVVLRAARRSGGPSWLPPCSAPSRPTRSTP